MEVYISLLRGINVSGQKKIKMTELKTIYEKLGFDDVKTYIQSGNVLFKVNNKTKREDIIFNIEDAILKSFGFNVTVILRTFAEMKNAQLKNPMLKNIEFDSDRFYVSFLSEEPDLLKIQNIKNITFTPEQFEIIGNEVFIYCPNGYGNTKLSNDFFERKLKLKATTRNWNSVNKLVELAESM